MAVLAGDIGGTKSLLALFEERGGGRQVVREERFDSRTFPGLGPIVSSFLAAAGTLPETACFGVPGAVVDGVCHTPNLPWVISEAEVAATTGIPTVRLVNDFVAAARGVLTLKGDEVQTLQEGSAVAGGPKALLGAGTGLGEAVLIPDRERHIVLATEGGHADFAPRGVLQRALAAHVEERIGHVSVERVVSGPGLVNIYEFLAASGNAVSEAARAEVEGAADPAAAITRLALSRQDATCVQALDLLVEVYGAEAGNLALRSLPTGGLFVGGGIAPKIIAKMTDGTFMRAFLAKGRLASYLAEIPVHVVMEPRVGLRGAAATAFELDGAGS